MAVWLVSLLLLLQIPRLNLGWALEQPAQAHEVEIAGDVGATLHIEPNDTPRAGEEVLAWFALTRKGGESISLSACDCELSIYTSPNGTAPGSDAPVLSPTLAPVDAEGYENIPSAKFTFPNVGAYQLTMSGSPKQAGDFASFDLTFDVTVAAGVAVEDSSPSEPQNASAEQSEPILAVSEPEQSVMAEKSVGISVMWAVAGVGGIVLLIGGGIRVMNGQKS